jgi:ubiquitin-like protein Pup
MAETKQGQKARSGGGGEGGDAPGRGAASKIEKKGADLKAEMDSLVEEIDAVLEENAEEFVKNYVQRGGE